MDALKKQIQDIDENITEATAVYGDLITRLVRLKSDVVDREFEEFERDTQSLTKKQSAAQILTMRMVKLHYDRYLKDKRSVNASVMEKDCVR